MTDADLLCDLIDENSEWMYADLYYLMDRYTIGYKHSVKKAKTFKTVREALTEARRLVEERKRHLSGKF